MLLSFLIGSFHADCEMYSIGEHQELRARGDIYFVAAMNSEISHDRETVDGLRSPPTDHNMIQHSSPQFAPRDIGLLP